MAAQASRYHGRKAILIQGTIALGITLLTIGLIGAGIQLFPAFNARSIPTRMATAAHAGNVICAGCGFEQIVEPKTSAEIAATPHVTLSYMGGVAHVWLGKKCATAVDPEIIRARWQAMMRDPRLTEPSNTITLAAIDAATVIYPKTASAANPAP